MAPAAQRNGWWRLSPAWVSGLTLAALLFSGCFAGDGATSTPSPFLIPGTHEVEYQDDELKFSFRHANDWLISDHPDTLGVVASLASPEGSITIDIERDIPPPQIDVMSYGSARMDFFTSLQPGLMILEEKEVVRTDETPSYYARWVSRNEDAESSGETLVVFRGEGDDREAFFVVSAGPTALYNAWTGPILLFYESLTIGPAVS